MSNRNSPANSRTDEDNNNIARQDAVMKSVLLMAEKDRKQAANKKMIEDDVAAFDEMFEGSGTEESSLSTQSGTPATRRSYTTPPKWEDFFGPVGSSPFSPTPTKGNVSKAPDESPGTKTIAGLVTTLSTNKGTEMLASVKGNDAGDEDWLPFTPTPEKRPAKRKAESSPKKEGK